MQRDEQESVASLDVLPGYSFTPDSKAIIVSYGGKIWRVPAVPTAGARRRPTHDSRSASQTQIDSARSSRSTTRSHDRREFTVRQIRDAVPSPDGKRLAFVALDKLYVMDFPAGTPRRLTDLTATTREPAWSPDGQSIAFVTWTRDGGSLYKVRAPGGTPVQLTHGQRALRPAGVVAGRQARRRAAQSRPDGSRVRAASSGRRGAHLGSRRRRQGDVHCQRVRQERAALHEGHDAHLHVWPGRGTGVAYAGTAATRARHLRVTGARSRSPRPVAPLARQRRSSGWHPRAIRHSRRSRTTSTSCRFRSPARRRPSRSPIPRRPSFRRRKLTDVGAQFPSWSADGKRVHWSIGNSHFVYDLDRARQFDDSVAAARRARGDTTGAARATGHDAARHRPGGKSARLSTGGDAHRHSSRGATSRRARRVFRNARVVTMKGNEIIERGDIVVRNNRIVAVGAAGTVQVPAGAREIDVTGKTIVPGFVDTHAHLRLTQGVHQQPWSYLANLAYGVTTTRDPQTGTTDVLTYEDAVDGRFGGRPAHLLHRPRAVRLELRAGSGRGHQGPRARAAHHATLQPVLRYEDAQDVHGRQPAAAAVDHHGREGAAASCRPPRAGSTTGST